MTLDLDSVAAMEVCRACLATNVKMYHMSEHKLSVLFERVTGVEITMEDKLPQMLCWECVSRLSSANKFVVKALNAQQILLNIMDNNQFITISDIESIDKDQNQLKSSLSSKFYKVNNSNLHIIAETDDFSAKCKSGRFGNHNTYGTRGYMASVATDSFSNTENQIVGKKELTENNENFQIKREQVYIKVETHCESGNSDCDADVRATDYYDNEKPIESEILFEYKNNFMETQTSSEDTIKTSMYIKPKIENLTISDYGNSSLMFSVKTSTVNSNISFTQNNSDCTKNLFICDVCDKSFLSKNNLIQHIRQHTKLYSCTYCSFKTYYNSNLSSHINCKHTKKSVFNCSYCNYVAYKKPHLNTHINSKHTKDIFFNCTFCSFKSHRKCSLSAHINSKHSKKVSFNCSYCSYKTYRKRHLSAHINARHTKDISFDCSYCSFKTFQRSSLGAHINAKHTKILYFDCPYCSFKAFKNSSLTAHINAKHTKNIIYNCDFCSYTAYLKCTLRKHVAAKHAKDKSFDCTFCSYKTYLKSSFNRHVKVKHAQSNV